MKNYFISSLLLTLTFFVQGQSSYSSQLVKSKLDSAFSKLSLNCQNIVPTQHVSKKTIKQDKITINSINKLYYNDFTPNQIEHFISRTYKRNWQFREVTRFAELTLYKGALGVYGNLEFRISVAAINGEVISKKILLKTKTQLECQSPYHPYISWYDIPYLLNHVLPFIKPALHVYEEYPEIVIDTTLENKINNISPNYQSLLLGDSSRFFNNLTWHSIDSYVGSKYNPLKQYNLSSQSILEKLVYSPNHIVAIYAYEILKDSGIDLSKKTKEQMNQVFNSPIQIKWMILDDVLHSGKTYKELIDSMPLIKD